MATLTFILEDADSDRLVLESHLRAIGCVSTAYSTMEDAIRGADASGDIYRAYILDMKTPLHSGGEPQYGAGLSVRAHLLEKGVASERIYLMSGGVSLNDEIAATEFHVDPKQILEKSYLTEGLLTALLRL